MKKFFVNVFSSMLGFSLAIGIFLTLGIIIMAGTIASSSTQPSLEDKSVLHIQLNGLITEQAQEDPLSEITGDRFSSIAVNQTLEAIRKAKNIKEIKGIFLEGGQLVSDPASLQEIRKALVDFKKSGKFIFCYADNYTQSAYYLCSVADKIAMNPRGTIDWHGLAAQPVFFKDLLAKVGIKMQVFKVGTFKSAVEPFTNTEMSEANRLQVTAYLNSIWSNYVKDVAASRHVSTDSLQHMADRYTALQEPDVPVKANMIDTLVFIDEAKNILKKYAKVEKDEKISLISTADLCLLDDPKAHKSKNKIAVYYAAGDIVDEAVSGFSTQSQIVGDKVVKDLQMLQDDNDIKAVVLRINSGGGSAYASEQMWHAITQLDKKKPVIISMGGMAASGGYYMSCAGRYIVAEPTTLTGSIGIFGMFPDASELKQQKLGLKYDVVKTNAMSDFFNQSRPFNTSESALLQSYIERGYNLFLKRVADGRKKTATQIDAIAQGRVWTGEQALKIGLVDKLGTLDDAIAIAASKAGIAKDYESKEYPEAEPWYINILNTKKNNYFESQMRETLGEYYEAFKTIQSIRSSHPIQARIPYNPNIQ